MPAAYNSGFDTSRLLLAGAASLGVPAHSTPWIALLWILGILAVFVPLSVRVYRRATSAA